MPFLLFSPWRKGLLDLLSNRHHLCAQRLGLGFTDWAEASRYVDGAEGGRRERERERERERNERKRRTRCALGGREIRVWILQV